MMKIRVEITSPLTTPDTLASKEPIETTSQVCRDSIHGLAQDYGDSSALAMELPQSYAKPSI